MRKWMQGPPEWPVFRIGKEDLPARKPDVRISVKIGDLPGKAVWQRNVVGIHPCDELSPRERQPFVQRQRNPPVLARKDLDPWVASSRLGQDATGLVPRSVINDDELEIRKALVQNAIDGLLKI